MIASGRKRERPRLRKTERKKPRCKETQRGDAERQKAKERWMMAEKQRAISSREPFHTQTGVWMLQIYDPWGFTAELLPYLLVIALIYCPSLWQAVEGVTSICSEIRR